MHHYFESITNKSGDVLVGYFARVIDPATQNTVTLSADNNGTPIVTVSGVENMAKSDENGNLSLYVEPGTYNLEIYAPNATSFILRVPNVAMNSGKGPPGDPGANGDDGPPGPADNTYTSYAAMQASDPSRKSARLVGDTDVPPRPDATYSNPTQTVGGWVIQSADGVAFTYPVSAARARRWAEVQSKQVELSGFTGADTTGGTDSYAAAQAWLARAIERKGEAIVDAGFRIKLNGRPPLRITTPVTIKGAKHITSNTTALSSHDNGLYFDQDAPESIVVDAGGQLTIDRAVILGPSRVSTYPGIKTVAENCALRLCGGALVQGWQIGLKIENGYYHRIHDASIVDCVTGLQVSAPTGLPPIYNLGIEQLKIECSGIANSTCISIFGGSQVSIAKSSFEGFTGNGVVLVDSALDLLSSYFEGFGGWNVFLGNYGRVNAIGNRVFLNTGANRFISVEGGGTVGAQIRAAANQFNLPGDASPVDIYSFRNDDPAAVSDIGGDIYLANPGANVRYLGSAFTAGMGPAVGRGAHSIRYPGAHPLIQHPVSTLPVNIAPAQALFPSPDPSMMLPYGMNAPAEDPNGLRSSWGSFPMQSVFHKSTAVPAGQWEKVGLLLPYRAPPTDAAGAVAWITQLTADLRAQGVMRNP